MAEDNALSQTALERMMFEDMLYLKAIASATAKLEAKRAIDTYEKARVFGSLDGNKTHYDISDELKIPRETVRNWVREFVGAALATSPSKYWKSHKALYSLDELNISLDSLRSRSKRKRQNGTKADASAKSELSEGDDEVTKFNTSNAIDEVTSGVKSEK